MLRQIVKYRNVKTLVIYVRYYVTIPIVRFLTWVKNPKKYEDPFKHKYIDPFLIEDALPQLEYRKYARVWKTKVIKSGDWDTTYHDLVNQQMFRMMEKRYRLNMDWHEITEYVQIFNDIKNGKRNIKCSSLKELEDKKALFDNMAKTMKSSGFLTQKQLGSKKLWDEIRVAITRKGKYLFIDGRHRLAIARALRIKKVPVIISIIHKDFAL